VLVAPGSMFAATDEVRDKHAWKCFRLCFAAAPRLELEGISGRFVAAVRKFWEIKEVRVIDKLLEDLEGEERVEDGMGMLTGMC